MRPARERRPGELRADGVQAARQARLGAARGVTVDGALLGRAVQFGERGRGKALGRRGIALFHGGAELLDLSLELRGVGAVDCALLARTAHLSECGVVIRHAEKPLVSLNPVFVRANSRRIEIVSR